MAPPRSRPRSSIKLTSVSEVVEIDHKSFEDRGAFDAVLGADSKLFVDPFLLSFTRAPEFNGGREKLLGMFRKILELVALSNSDQHHTWRVAERLLRFPEPQGFSFGYGGVGSTGSGMGPQIRNRVLKTVSEIVSKGITDPEILELLGLFEEDVGADRISDMVCNVLSLEFHRYSHRVFAEVGAKNLREFSCNSEKFALAVNPFSGGKVLIAPIDILRDLPIAHSYDDISTVCAANEELRSRLNRAIARHLTPGMDRLTKPDLKKLLIENPDAIIELLKTYKVSEPNPYDLKIDPLAVARPYHVGLKKAAEQPLRLELTSKNQDEILGVVVKICDWFRHHIEDSDLWKELYKDTEFTKAKIEKTSQRLFYAIAKAHCQYNNLDLSPEANAGRGPVDFKLSRGNVKVLVEVKLAHHPKLVHALETQVQLYQAAEQTKDAILLVVKVKERNPQLDSLLRTIDEIDAKGLRRPRVLVVYGLPQTSASRA